MVDTNPLNWKASILAKALQGPHAESIRKEIEMCETRTEYMKDYVISLRNFRRVVRSDKAPLPTSIKIKAARVIGHSMKRRFLAFRIQDNIRQKTNHGYRVVVPNFRAHNTDCAGPNCIDMLSTPIEKSTGLCITCINRKIPPPVKEEPNKINAYWMKPSNVDCGINKVPVAVNKYVQVLQPKVPIQVQKQPNYQSFYDNKLRFNLKIKK